MKQKSTTKLDGTNLKVAIILPRFNDHIGEPLQENTIKALKKLNVTKIETIRCPGALEIPFIAQKLAPNFDVIIALGVIIKGDTAHFDIVCTESARGIMQVSLKTETPIINGILTCYTEDQALERSKDKGKEFAESAIEMGLIIRYIKTRINQTR